MTGILERITPEMSEEEVLGVILDEIMARAKPDVAEAIRFCAIPHWFNEEIIAWLRGEGVKPSWRSRDILAALTELTFVGPYPEWGWAYHENVRDLLLRRWRERDVEGFKELSGRAAGYFGQKAEAATDEERDEWERERVYHLLVADEEQGYELFQSMFDEAIKFYRLGTCSLLLHSVRELREHLSREHQLWLRDNQRRLARQSAQSDRVTGLPSGRLIEEQLRLLLRRENWALMYIGISGFGPFKEAYGLESAKTLLRITASTLLEAVGELGTVDDFVGHVREDDFVVITVPARAQVLMDRIRGDFKRALKDLVTVIKQEKGEQEVAIPLLDLFIGLLTGKERAFTDIRELAEAAAKARRQADKELLNKQEM